MDKVFEYSNSVSGRNFIGRTADVRALSNMLMSGQHVALYGAPKCGLTSLMQQVFLQMRSRGHDFVVTEVPLQNVRTLQQFLCRLGEAIIKLFATTPTEYSTLVSQTLLGTHFTFDQARYEDSGELLSVGGDPLDMEDALAVFRLPYLMAQERGTQVCVVLKDFNTVILMEEDYDLLLKTFEGALKEQKDSALCSFVFAGSALNAMKFIFEECRYFYKQVERYSPSIIEDKTIIEHITRSFLSSGKVVDNELLIGVCRLFRCDIWYINHFMSICDHLSKGYIMEPVLLEALEDMISLHRPRFKAMMNSLTTYQVSLLKAILDGQTRLSSASVIEAYGLNSSANVKRLKDALTKKEIVTFDERDVPMIIDPLFEYWLRRDFFGQKVGL